MITKDAFQPALPLSVVIHINYHDAPKVIQRFGDIKTLVEETIDPLVGAYFKNIGQTKTLLELIQDRNEIQKKAAEEMKTKFAEYDLNLVEVLIGTPRPSNEDSRIGEIYQQLQDRQLAKEESITLEAKTANERKKREFAQAQQEAAMQEELTASEKQIIIVENQGKAEVKKAEQAASVMEKNARAAATKTEIDAEAGAKRLKIMAQAEADQEKIKADAGAYTVTVNAKAKAESITLEGEAEADKIARKGIADGIATSERVNAMGATNMVQMEIAKEMAAALMGIQGNLVPNSVVNLGGENGGDATSNLLNMLFLKFFNPELLGEIAGEGVAQSESAKAMTDKIKGEVLAKATTKNVDESADTTVVEENGDAAVEESGDASDNNDNTVVNPNEEVEE